MNEQDNKETMLQKKPIFGIIFDLDGTLIESVVNFPKMKQNMIQYINTLGIGTVDYNIHQTTNEIILDFHLRLVDQGIPQVGRDTILENISEILTDVEFENVKKVELLPGVKEFLKSCSEAGINMGILTRASGKYTDACLERTEIKEYFSAIISRDDFTLLRAKPHPFALNFIIKKLAVPPENIIFVGDHKIDYDCATQGNIRFVGVLAGAYNRSMLSDLGCRMLVEDFNELSDFVSQNNR